MADISMVKPGEVVTLIITTCFTKANVCLFLRNQKRLRHRISHLYLHRNRTSVAGSTPCLTQLRRFLRPSRPALARTAHLFRNPRPFSHSHSHSHSHSSSNKHHNKRPYLSLNHRNSNNKLKPRLSNQHSPCRARHRPHSHRRPTSSKHKHRRHNNSISRHLSSSIK